MVFTLKVGVPHDIATSVGVQYIGTDGPQLKVLRLKGCLGRRGTAVFIVTENMI